MKNGTRLRILTAFFLSTLGGAVEAQTVAAKSQPAAAAASSPSDAALKRAKASYQSGQYREAETALSRLIKQNPKAAAAEEAAVILIDAQIRQNKTDAALAGAARFRRNYPGSPLTPRVDYYSGVGSLRQGRNLDAAKSFAAAAAAAKVQGVYESAAKGLRSILDGSGLASEEIESIVESLDADQALQAEVLEKLGDQHMRDGKYQAAKNAFGDWLEKFGARDGSGASRVKAKRQQAEDAPRLGKIILLMAPMSGEFSEIGKSLREGALMAVEEQNQKGGPRVDTRVLDDQGNLIVGIHRLRKTLREEKIDGIVGPAMSDVSAAAAVDLSARKSPIPMVTPTATTHGIAALGDGIFQLNVTTGTLGQKIASYAVGCLKLKDFAIVAPESEYGYQLAEAFQKTVERKGGSVISVQYFTPGSNDMAAQFDEVRKAALKLWLEKQRQDGVPDPDAKAYAKIVSDSTIPLDGIFLPANNGEEANMLASQASFGKLRAQFLGSSGWNDKSILHKNSSAPLGTYFSVDFQENPKTEVYLAFQKNYSARWKRSPDKVAALAYDAARFLLQGLTSPGGGEDVIPTLRGIRSFNGVVGRIVFDEKYGANQNAALYRVEKRGFKEVEACPEAE